ncbi:hypothetical protein [Streptomyces sp. NPDC050264]|uniref:hypothetical protein n=1 Tax=Streptomyces sp. NPDC050264 TaxID=3155038 RepID=UPI0034475C05
MADPVRGDGTLINAVTGPDGSTCEPGADDPQCTTTAKVTDPPDKPGTPPGKPGTPPKGPEALSGVWAGFCEGVGPRPSSGELS